MGAWGVLAFDNDQANDWAYDLEDRDDLSLVEEAFEAVGNIDGYLDSGEACNALAACEVVARINGKPGYKNAYTKNVDEWVAARSLELSPELLARANGAIDRILADDSELKELWAETDTYARWMESVEDLRQRMGT